ncbi:MAG: class I SAM-dependent methyltransferase [Anaerolineae bacterium]
MNFPTSHTDVSALHDVASRRRKTEKIRKILEAALGSDLSALRCLDVGCASGMITRELAQQLRSTIGLEYDRTEIEVIERPWPVGLFFVHGDATTLPFCDDSIDLVLCAQVYEHVIDARALASEVFRVLKPGGACFFSGPNRLDIIERHYGLPFVSWLPRSIADTYIRFFRKGTRYYEHPLSYWALKSLWGKLKRVDFTWKMIKNPEKYACVEELGGLAWLRYLPGWFLRLLTPFYPNFNWMLFKPSVQGV